MKNFATRVNLPVIFIRTETLVSCRLGVDKRLRKEMNLLYAAAPEQKEYVKRRRENIRRLRIIRKELKQLEKQM
jgi:hypothetical protein